MANLIISPRLYSPNGYLRFQLLAKNLSAYNSDRIQEGVLVCFLPFMMGTDKVDIYHDLYTKQGIPTMVEKSREFLPAYRLSNLWSSGSFVLTYAGSHFIFLNDLQRWQLPTTQMLLDMPLHGMKVRMSDIEKVLLLKWAAQQCTSQNGLIWGRITMKHLVECLAKTFHGYIQRISITWTISISWGFQSSGWQGLLNTKGAP